MVGIFPQSRISGSFDSFFASAMWNALPRCRCSPARGAKRIHKISASFSKCKQEHESVFYPTGCEDAAVLIPFPQSRGCNLSRDNPSQTRTPCYITPVDGDRKRSAVLRARLACSGDIETNPGPLSAPGTCKLGRWTVPTSLVDYIDRINELADQLNDIDDSARHSENNTTSLGWWTVPTSLIGYRDRVRQLADQLNTSVTEIEQDGPTNRRRHKHRSHNQHRKNWRTRQTAPPKFFSILQANVDGYTRVKRTELATLAREKRPEVICIQETKMTPNSRMTTINGYRLIRKDRALGRANQDEVRGGGLAIFVKNDIQHVELSETPLGNEEDTTTEWMGLQVKTQAGDIGVYNIYRPPIRNTIGDNREDNFEPESLMDEPNTVITGDFNCHDAAWDPYAGQDQMGRRLLEALNDGNLALLNDGSSTRKSRSTNGESAPDLTLVSSNLLPVCTWEALPVHIGSSDHKVILTTMNITTGFSKGSKRNRPNFRKADWPHFKQLIEDEINSNRPLNINDFTEMIIRCSTLAIPLTSSRKRQPLPWMDREVRDAIKKKNAAASVSQESEENRRAWTDQCKVTDQLILTKQSDAWKEKASGFDRNTNPSAIYNTIRRIEGRAKPPPTASGISGNGKVLYGQKKANAYVSLITSWSAPLGEPRKQQRSEKRQIRREIKSRKEEPAGEKISKVELQDAIRDLNLGKAAGPDEIHAEHLKNLPNNAIECLLGILNLLLEKSNCPAIWKKSFVIPILKPNKPANTLSSYRPISLTSTLCKVMEKIILKRITPILENENILSQEQAGFRQARGCEDQIAVLAQSIYDANEKSIPGKRTVLATIDFAHAFPSVMHTKLILRLLDANIPIKIVKWIKMYLEDRRSKVLFDGESNWKKIGTSAGLPQGSCLSPAMFILFIDPLIQKLKQHDQVNISMFADDLAVWTNGPIHTAETMLQPALHTLEEWSLENGMVIAPEKCYASIFTLSPQEAKATVKLHLCGKELKNDNNITFLGLKFDRMLGFRGHGEATARKMTSRLNALKCMSGLDWGQKESTMRQLAKTTIEAVAAYGVSTYGTFGCNTATEVVDKVLRSAARVTTGALKSTPIGPLMAESDLRTVKDLANERAAIQVEKAARVPSHPLRKIEPDSEITRRRYKRRTGNFHDNAKKLIREAGLQGFQREGIPAAKNPSSLEMELHETAITKQAPKEERRRKAEELLSNLPSTDCIVWSDGSTQRGYEIGGSGGVVVFRDGRKETYKCAAGRFCSSYRAELLAMKRGIEISAEKGAKTIRICCDSLSALKRIREGPTKQTCKIGEEILDLLKRFEQIQLAHVPAHVGIEENELADQAAKEGSRLPQLQQGIDITTAIATVKRASKRIRLEDLQSKESESARLFFEQTSPVNIDDLPRRLQIQIRRLRIGHSTLLGAYRKRIGLENSDKCSDCQMGAIDTQYHFLCECPRWNRLRNSIWGSQLTTLRTALKEPLLLAQYLERTSRLSTLA